MSRLLTMLRATRGKGRLDWTDWASYLYLTLGLAIMFGPVLWLLLSSFKTEAGLIEFPPRLLPYEQAQLAVPGYPKPLPLYEITAGEMKGRKVAEIRRVGLQAQMVDPANPGQTLTSLQDAGGVIVAGTPLVIGFQSNGALGSAPNVTVNGISLPVQPAAIRRGRYIAAPGSNRCRHIPSANAAPPNLFC